MNNELYSEIEVTSETASEVGLTQSEYEKILEILGRTPTYTELGIFGVMWSEHCSYKNSIKQLKTLPRSGGRLLVEAGEENAGLVDIGTDKDNHRYAICFKIESHNHPSAIEPFQGAATGVGGILRDVFSMGARPIASLNSLRFGELDTPRIKYLLSGVVRGIGHYGNCFGVPTVAGEVYFDDCYHDNPLVNAMAVGIVRTDRTATAAASGAGNPVVIVGSSTGRDGIHGASLLASREFDEKTEDMRPTVQVGDPFAEKMLLEVTLELIKAGVVVGVQDMGAAGICCSTSEMSARSGAGMSVDLDLVPLREDGMSAYEIMLSESQERMLFVIDKNRLEEAMKIASKWDVPMVKIGEVTDDGILHIWRNGKKVVEMKSEPLVLGGGAPIYDRETKEPEYLKQTREFDINSEVQRIASEFNLQDIFIKILTSPNVASKRWVYEQYDPKVRSNTVSIIGDSAIIRLKEIPNKAIALKTDCNSRYVYLDPYRGAMIAVAEAARNCVCVGAEPVAVTNCLNFGNPYDPEVYWTFKEAVRGMGDACRALNTPVTGGNVSFHNESRSRAVFPTPTIGMLGLIDDLNKIMTSGFKNIGDKIILLGPDRQELGGSEFLKLYTGLITGVAPEFDINEEKNLYKLLLKSIKKNIINSAHDCSEGGLAVCLAEMSINSDNNLGCKIDFENSNENINSKEKNIFKYFGETQSRVVVSVSKENYNKFDMLCKLFNVNFKPIGSVAESIFEIDDNIKIEVNSIRKLWNEAIENKMKSI